MMLATGCWQLVTSIIKKLILQPGALAYSLGSGHYIYYKLKGKATGHRLLVTGKEPAAGSQPPEALNI